MKNIHLLPTENPSRLWYNSLSDTDELLLSIVEVETSNNQHIYITSDEEIKAGKYVIDLENNEVFISLGKMDVNNYIKKIILTTDPDLIADGVQAIDDEFLEWFVKNPSCECVKVDKPISRGIPLLGYRIIIPQEEAILTKWDRLNKELEDALESAFGPEEPKYSEDEFEMQSRIINKVWDEEESKKETLEEAVRIHLDKNKYSSPLTYGKIGAKWESERGYNEQIALINWLQQSLTAKKFYSTDAEDLIEQFKRK